jgi:hypothetical protein
MRSGLKFLAAKLFWGFLRHLLNDKWYAKIRYWIELDSWPNLQNPKTFTEKIQWIKLNEHTKLRQIAANRAEVRDYVAQKVGAQHLVPLLGVYEKLTQSTWKQLPEQFVLKGNHGSGMIEIVHDKENASFDDIRQETKRWKQTDYYRFGREWAYKDVPKTIVAEELLLDSNNDIPNDYKFFCFNGGVEIIQIDSDRFGEHRQTLFDRSFNRIDGRLHSQPASDPIPKPDGLEEGIGMAEKLSADFSFIRVDLYILDGQPYFGELTNYPLNGFIAFKPKSLEEKMGSLLNIDQQLNQP